MCFFGKVNPHWNLTHGLFKATFRLHGRFPEVRTQLCCFLMEGVLSHPASWTGQCSPSAAVDMSCRGPQLVRTHHRAVQKLFFVSVAKDFDHLSQLGGWIWDQCEPTQLRQLYFPGHLSLLICHWKFVLPVLAVLKKRKKPKGWVHKALHRTRGW